jgi:hypothetical protein|tara:strand:- start:27 stop:428 length:402 start_codon:yes stop_codon:yes gene_type:complete
MASLLKVDALTGVTAAGSISVTGEGGSTTTNLQQGLAKYWVTFSMVTVSQVHDSLNHSSFTDNSTGNASISFTNSFSNTLYSGAGMSVHEANVCWLNYSSNYLTGSNVVITQDNNANGLDEDKVGIHIMGDLA